MEKKSIKIKKVWERFAKKKKKKCENVYRWKRKKPALYTITLNWSLKFFITVSLDSLYKQKANLWYMSHGIWKSIQWCFPHTQSNYKKTFINNTNWRKWYSNQWLLKFFELTEKLKGYFQVINIYLLAFFFNLRERGNVDFQGGQCKKNGKFHWKSRESQLQKIWFPQ